MRFDTNFNLGACSLGQDRGHPASRKTPAAIHRSDEFSFLSSNPCGCPERNDLLPYRVFGMRARTCQQPPARPEAAVYRVLSGLPRAKFRPDRGPCRQRIRARNGPEISLASSVTPGPPRSSWPQEVPMRRLLLVSLAVLFQKPFSRYPPSLTGWRCSLPVPSGTKRFRGYLKPVPLTRISSRTSA